MKKFLRVLLDILYPCFCPGCRVKITFAEEFPLCCDCRDKIRPNSPPFCQKCGAVLEGISVGSCCKNKVFFFDRAYSVVRYEGAVKTGMHLFKYQRRLRWKRFFSGLITAFIESNLDFKRIDLIMPVPLHPLKLLDRGFNQAEILAAAAAEKLNIPLSTRNLIRRRNTRPQFSVEKDERLKNIAGAFAFKDKTEFKGKTILLIDDIFTSGATLNECSRVLKQAGAGGVIALTLAQ